MPQKHAQKQRQGDSASEVEKKPHDGSQARLDTSEIDDLLAEIDEVLGSEVEAEAFIAAFVQRGGE